MPPLCVRARVSAVNRTLASTLALILTCSIVVGALLLSLRSGRDDVDGVRTEFPRRQVPNSPGHANGVETASTGEGKTNTGVDGSFGAFSRFNRWTTSYLCEVDPRARRELLAEGVVAAEERNRALYQLIGTDPKAALRQAVPWAVRRALPPDVDRWLEKRVGGIGDLLVAGAVPAAETSLDHFRSIRREVLLDGHAYDAYVAGRRLEDASRRSLAIHGIALGDRMAVSDSPVRLLDAGEPAPPGRTVVEICSVSGVASGPNAKSNGQPLLAADTGDRVIYLCSADHITALEGALEVAGAGTEDGRTGAPSMVTAAPVSGNRGVLIIRVRFSDQAAGYEPQTVPATLAMVAGAGRFFRANSRGMFDLQPTVTPVYTLPKSSAWYSGNDTSGYARNVLEATRQVAANPAAYAGNSGLPAFNYLDHDMEVVCYTGGPGSFSGQAYVGLRGVWLKSGGAGVLAHEISHNLGLWHANAWVADDAEAIIGPGRNSEYGDIFDTMGRYSGEHLHLNAYEKHALGWIDASSIAGPSGSGGITRLEAHDLEASAASFGARALKIRRDFDRDLWVELRQHAGWAGNRWVMNGVGLRWDPWLSSNGGTQVLDATPQTVEGHADSPLVIGRTFSDPIADIHVTPVAMAQGSGSAMDVDVRVGPFPGNRAPIVGLEVSASAVEPDAVVTFRAVASDEDGDDLSYAWEFEDRSVHPSEPVVLAGFPTAGYQRVRVVISDRRGLNRSASAVVRVGNPSGTLIHGRVVDAAGNPVSDVRIHNGAPAPLAAHRHACTDSDGRFALTNLSDGSWTIAAERPGWTFARHRFLNPLSARGASVEAHFIGEFLGYTIAGMVRAADGSPVANAVVSSGDRSEPTDSSGTFAFQGMEAGAYPLAARKGDRVFGGQTVEVGYSDVTGVSLAEWTFQVSGEVTGGDPHALVTITDGVRSTTAAPQSDVDGTRLVFGLAGVPAGIRNLIAITGEASYSPVNFASPLLVEADRGELIFARDETPDWLIMGRVTEAGEGVAGVTISAGVRSTTTAADGRYFLTGMAAGGHVVTASRTGVSIEPARREVTIENGPMAGVDFTARVANAAPHFTRAAVLEGDAERPFVQLSAAADDGGGAEVLRYRWSVVEGAAPGVVFLRNGSNGARRTAATFPAVGTYRIRVTASDARGSSASSDLIVLVPQVASQLVVQPLADPVWIDGTVQFRARCTDQFGADMPLPGALSWSVSGGGSIDAAGLFSAREVGNNFVVRATMGEFFASADFAVGFAPGAGTGITQEIWTGITGATVAQLTSNPSFPSRPGVVSVLTGLFESPTGYGHNYGQRLRGYFIPPVTGEYVFFLASNNASELWVSPDGDSEHRSRVAFVEGATAWRDWEATAEQQTSPMALSEGQAVYLEVLHKEDSADDHLAVGVRLPGGIFERPIPTHRFMPLSEAVFGPPSIEMTASAIPAVVDSSLAATVRVSASSAGGEGNLTYRWDVVGDAPGAVAFVPNGTASARIAMARFTRAGPYQLRVVATDMAGQTAESTVGVVVKETLVSWRMRHFTRNELDTPALEARRWGADADPDGDGVVNLLEYAFGLDPLVPSREGLPVSGMVTIDGDEYLSISFRRNPDATDVEFTPQASSDLRTWESGLPPVSSDLPGGPFVHRDVRPAREFDKRFMRVHVTGP